MSYGSGSATLGPRLALAGTDESGLSNCRWRSRSVARFLWNITIRRIMRGRTQWDDSDMSFTIEIIIFTIVTGIAGSFLANHYSVYALLLVTLFFFALAAAGCVVYGASLSGSAIAALSGVAGLQFGYLLRLFLPRTVRRWGATSSGLKRPH